MDPLIRYARAADGVRIAYWTMGEGPPLLLASPLATDHIVLECRYPPLMEWYEHLAAYRTVIRYDQRGSGLSDRDVELTREGFIADIESLRDAFQGMPLEIISTARGAGSRAALPFAAAHPEDVSKLVLVVTATELTRPHRETNKNPKVEALAPLLDEDFYGWTEALARLMLGWQNDEIAHQWAGFLRASRDAAGWRRWAEYDDVEGDELLPLVRAETLVIYRPLTARAQGLGWAREAAAEIGRARYVELLGERGAERAVFYASADFQRLVDGFLGVAEPPATAPVGGDGIPGGTVVLLFTDIAGSTVLTEAMGDAPFRAAARELDQRLRSAIRDSGGVPVEGLLLGDGVLAVFTAARDAVTAAHRCVELGRETGLELHVGLHAGDVIHENNNVYGGAVNIAARVCGLSAPGEVLASATVRELARTSIAATFEDRGPHRLKGIDEPVRVFAITSVESS